MILLDFVIFITIGELVFVIVVKGVCLALGSGYGPICASHMTNSGLQNKACLAIVKACWENGAYM